MLLAAAVTALVTATSTASPAPIHLRVEGLHESVAVISEATPRFSFVHGDLATPRFGVTQASYRITVVDTDAEADDAGATLWDSGDVKSSNCSQIVYTGKALAPFARYTWTAEWTSSDGDKSAQASSRFETGPMAVADWQNAGWLSVPGKSQLRNEFSVAAGKKVAFARAYVAAAGCAHIEVNGVVPQPDLRGICPWPVTTASVRYVTHDITDLVTPGKNALGMVEGNVMQAPKAILLVAIKFQGETAPTFALSSSSAGWMATESYVTTATAWDSAIDWTKQETGWSTTAFSPGAGWSAAKASPAGGKDQVSARALAMPLSTVLDEVKPISVLKTADGGFLYTFPKNFVGTIKFQPLPSATSGSNLTVLLGEWLVPSMPAPKPPAPTPKPARCGRVAENHKLALACPGGKKIDSIVFASFGTPDGGCPTGFKDGICSKTGKIGTSNQSLAVVQKACVGKESCTVDASNAAFGGPNTDPCPLVVKSLAAEVHCSGDPPGATCAGSCYNGAPPPPPPPAPPPSGGANTYPKISGGKQQYENHVLRAGNTEPLTTLFCWHGFQYVRVTPGGATGFTGALDAIVGQAIHTNMTQVGQLTFGGEGDPGAEDAAEVLTHINAMTLQSQRTNVAAYMPTDCPTREKHGWMGDALDGSEQALMNFEMGPIHEAFMQVVEDNQNPTTGDVPVVVPGGAGNCGDIAWTSAYPQITAMQHQYYSDTRTLERKFSSLVKYTENLISNADSSASNAHEGLAVCDQFKDWLCGNAQSCCTHKGSPSCPVGAEMGGFNYVLGLRAMSQMAAVLGNSTAAARYADYASKGTKEFHTYFFNSTVNRYGGDIGATQSLSLPALKIGSPPASVYPEVVKTVGSDLKSINYTLSVGAVTSKILFNMLSENGLHESALRTAVNTEEPSIGHWWKKWNATTCYEAFPNTNSPTNPSGTLNHIFLCGGIGHWMWKHLVGLTPAAPGFAEVSLVPRIHDSVGPRSVGGKFLSPKGVIKSAWKLSAGTVSLSVSLPVGVSVGTIVVPKPTTHGQPAAATSIKLGGTVIWDGAKLVGKPAGILSAKDQHDGVAFTTTNGQFSFESTAKSEWLAIL